MFPMRLKSDKSLHYLRKKPSSSSGSPIAIHMTPTTLSNPLSLPFPCHLPTPPRGRSWTVRSSDNLTAAADKSATAVSSSAVDSASGVVRGFYAGINGRDLTTVSDLIAETCVYEDLIFSRPFVGRKAILDFFQKFIDSISTDLKFVIDDISGEDTSAIGVTWHLEWKGKPFPFSKGCSFYRLDVVNGKRQIVYGRDCVEPATKPGELALVIIKGVTWLLQQFPQLADKL